MIGQYKYSHRDYDLHSDQLHRAFNFRRPKGYHHQTFRNCFGAVCDGELKVGITDDPFNSNIMNFTSSGQVTDLCCHM